MSDNHKKLYSKKETGTVPKVKYDNTSPFNEDERTLLSNNLGRDCNQPNFAKHVRNSGKYQTIHHFGGMEQLIDEQNVITGQNTGGLISPNDHSSQNVSDSISRRNSSDTIPKCDNITKYPDKKQIEDKLNQIREYLYITSTLMCNVKNADQSGDNETQHLEKIYSDLKDSEAKLNSILDSICVHNNDVDEANNVKVFENGLDGTAELASRLPKGVLEKKVESANRQLEMLREQENILVTLQMKAENQLREAQYARQKLSSNQNTANFEDPYDYNSNEINDVVTNSANKKANQDVLNELEDRINSFKTNSSTPHQSTINIQEQFQAQVDSIQQKLNQLRDSNDNRNQLIQLLDKRDVQLQSEHMELQGRLRALQNKKMQVDLLVSQLQNMNEESEEDDIGFQVRKIMSMKEQLSKLKDMLKIVKNSEDVPEPDMELLDAINPVFSKSDVIQNDVRGNQHPTECTSNSQLETIASSSNERKIKEKQINKKSMNANEKERMKLQAELHAKKRELEELMCKHKAASSNINQDVQSENKTDIGGTNQSLYEGTTNSWYQIPHTSDPYSSDDGGEDDINDRHSELNSSGEASNVHMIEPMAALNYPTFNYVKHKSAESSLEVPDAYIRVSAHTPEHSVHSTTDNISRLQERIRSNNERDVQNKNQIHKQLELIKSVCDSMLEQQTIVKEQTTHNVRNNLTPSPLYSEPRQFTSPNSHSANVLHAMHPILDTAWTPQNYNHSNVLLSDTSGYQHWLTTNTLQTQAFMLNTLNQCCQMLWLQQRELASLRNTITMMQEKLQASFDQNNSVPIYMGVNSCGYPVTVAPPEHREESQLRSGLVNSKNQVSSTTSLPNLNRPHATHSTNLVESAYANQNNLHNARILESSLNNSIHQNAISGHSSNTVLPSVNQSLPSQIWNGQALNNQVAPGNRANNYWDNFRSYSRQNLLSTKNNEELQNQLSASDRSNNTTERYHSYSLPTTSSQKHNQESSHSSADNTLKRKTALKSSRPSLNTENVNSCFDVVNINDTQSSYKTNENNDSLETTLQIGFEPILDTFEHLDTSTINLNTFCSSDCRLGAQRNRNELYNTNSENYQSKPKLFDELRENVYREVASLISANQGRPHFLIQLFRDLQMVNSDPMRSKTLQSIESLISNSLPCNTASTSQQVPNTQSVATEYDAITRSPSCFEIPTNSWNYLNLNIEENDSSLDTDYPNYMSEVLLFLNSHNDDVLQQNLLDSLKELLAESTFSTILVANSKDSIIQKQFVTTIIEAFEPYKGKRIEDVKRNILQTIENLLKGEISFTRLTKESIPTTNDFCSLTTNETSLNTTENLIKPQQIQNGDLAEADQSRVELEDDEEGAVGGVINATNECSDSNMEQIGTEFTEQGLDQVPTRLATQSRTQLNILVRDYLSSRTDASEQF